MTTEVCSWAPTHRYIHVQNICYGLRHPQLIRLPPLVVRVLHPHKRAPVKRSEHVMGGMNMRNTMRCTRRNSFHGPHKTTHTRSSHHQTRTTCTVETNYPNRAPLPRHPRMDRLTVLAHRPVGKDHRKVPKVLARRIQPSMRTSCGGGSPAFCRKGCTPISHSLSHSQGNPSVHATRGIHHDACGVASPIQGSSMCHTHRPHRHSRQDRVCHRD